MKEVVLGVTGSIAAYKACEIINRLKDHKVSVTVVMTKEAEEFITPLTLQTLSGNKLVGNLFALPDNINPAHISLAKKCDLILIAPATANIIARLASGLADDTLSCLCLSAQAPILICGAMNEVMYRHKITQDNIARLKKAGYHFLGPTQGHLVCGDKGIGHLSGVKDIVDTTLKLLARRR